MHLFLTSSPTGTPEPRPVPKLPLENLQYFVAFKNCHSTCTVPADVGEVQNDYSPRRRTLILFAGRLRFLPAVNIVVLC